MYTECFTSELVVQPRRVRLLVRKKEKERENKKKRKKTNERE